MDLSLNSGGIKMSRLIVLYNYNKYYNRIIKRKSSFQDYLNLITPNGNTPAAYKGFLREKMNFDYQDGVYAKHVINLSKNELELAIEHPDYCVLEESWTTGSGEEAVTQTRVSRYFILDVTKTRGLQLQLSMRRDLLADYYSEVTNAPVFIEKGWLNDIEDPAIFNRESMTYNQIKQGEILINNNKFSGKGGGWVVGYIAKEENNTAISGCTAITEAPESSIAFTSLPQWLQDAITNSSEIYLMDQSEISYSIGCWADSRGYHAKLFLNSDNSIQRIGFNEGSSFPYGCPLKLTNTMSNAANVEDYKLKFSRRYNEPGQSNIANLAKTLFETTYGASKCKNSSELYVYNGQYVIKDGKTYRINLSQPDDMDFTYVNQQYTGSQISAGSDSIALSTRAYINELTSEAGIDLNPDALLAQPQVYVSYGTATQKAYLTEANFDELHCDIPATRNENFDAPYDIFAIPLGIVDVKNSTTPVLTTINNVALPMARGISIEGTSTKILDMQILPYCPFDEILDSNGDIQISGFTEHKDYEYIYKTVSGVDTKIGIIIFPKSCKGTFDTSISSNDSFYDFCSEDLTTVMSKKKRTETQFARFVSPNFASTFEINIQKNKGITNLNVDYFYKPYSPYIHVAPYFNGLYGRDFNDPKGLICSGEFSIATASSKWEEYQIQNKNYELTFNRQIENLDVNNSIAYDKAAKQAGIGVVTSTLTGAGAGAASGAILGSIVPVIGTALGAAAGAAIGGAAGFISSAFGAKYDMEYLRKSQSEARSYAVDMYAYSLGNVQALPYTLTKVSAFTPNNKIFPFIELYDCTAEEKAALENKLTYNGMSIGRIGKIIDYMGLRYVQGQLIRLTGILEDSHVVAEIANEIKEGAYYYGTDSE